MLLCSMHRSLESQLICKVGFKDDAITVLVVFLGLQEGLCIAQVV